LKKLSISLKVAGDLPLSCLSDLKQLESLSLTRCTPLGLGPVLQSLSSLHELSLSVITLPQGVRIASSSLQNLSVDVLSPSLSSFLSVSRLPALRSLRFDTLDLSGSVVSDRKRFKRDVSELAAFPLKAMEASENIIDLVGNTTWSSDVSLSLLQTLSSTPMSTFFKSVKGLRLFSWNAVPGFMLALSDLIPRAASMEMSNDCVYRDHDHGFLDAITNMKSLEYLQLSLEFSACVPQDLLASLVAAKKSGRTILLELCNAGGLSTLLDELCKQWLFLNSCEEVNSEVKLVYLGDGLDDLVVS